MSDLRGCWVVCWYPRVLPRDSEDVQPLVKITVRDVDQPDITRAFRRPAVPVTALGQLRIGTVLEDGCRTAEVFLPQKTLRVVFGPACTTSQLRPLRRQLRQRPDWFASVALGGCALRLPLRGHGDLWIPSLEYFSRCYGRSQEVKRILLESPWEGVAEERLFAPVPPDEASSASAWRIRYGSAGSRMVPADAVFLAYVRHCVYAEACAKRLYSDLDIGQPATAAEEAARRRLGIPLDVGPWFLGPAKLKVRGLPLADGGFLALRVDGSSAPTSPADLDIVRLVASDDPSADEDDHSDPDVESDSTSRRRRRRISANGLPVAWSQAPAWNSREAQLPDTDFEELTPRRGVRTVRLERRSGPAPRVVPSPQPRQLSGAERGGSDRETGVALAFSPSVPSEDVLRDVWNALQFFRERYPSCVRTVDWFTPEAGFRPSLPLGFVRFRLDGPYSSRRAYPWVRLQPRVRRPRGIVVIRVGVSDGSGRDGTRLLYLVEIERRPPVRALEKFSGLIFDLERHGDSVEALRAWVDSLRCELPPRRGVFASLLDDCPGNAAIYQHLSPDHDRVRQETGLRNALRKMGVPRAALERSTR